MELELAGRSVLVTGGSSGIGLATARLLLEEGAIVTICGRSRERLERAGAELDSPDLCLIDGDVTEPDAAAHIVDAAVRHGGRLDGIAAIAGRGRRGSLLELDPSAVVDEIGGKLRALLHVTRSAAPHLRDTSGSIVALSAPTAFEPSLPMGAIGVGRAALDAAVRSLALELAPAGVRVNAVGVGLIDTPRQHAIHEDQGTDRPYAEWLTDEARRRRVPLGRAGSDREVATAITYLLSPTCGYTTGAVLEVTGGLRTR